MQRIYYSLPRKVFPQKDDNPVLEVISVLIIVTFFLVAFVVL